MNLKGFLNTRHGVIRLLTITLFALIFTGCATGSWGQRNMAGVSRYFDKDVNTVWSAITQTVEGIPIEINDKDHGFLKTQWINGWSTKKDTGLFLDRNWHERHRLLIKVDSEQNKTYVSISTQIEEKPPAGSQAYRWKRVASDGTIEQDFLKRLENILNTQ